MTGIESNLPISVLVEDYDIESLSLDKPSIISLIIKRIKSYF
jgi:hypothetical protein